MNSLDSQLSRASDGYHAKSTSVLLGRIYVGIRDESISTPTCLVGEPILPRSTTPFLFYCVCFLRPPNVLLFSYLLTKTPFRFLPSNMPFKHRTGWHSRGCLARAA